MIVALTLHIILVHLQMPIKYVDTTGIFPILDINLTLGSYLTLELLQKYIIAYIFDHLHDCRHMDSCYKANL